MKLNFNLSVIVLKEGNRFVAHSPALGLATSGKNFEDAKKHFTEAASLFFEEITRKGTRDQALRELGWTKQKKSWQPPLVVSSSIETISVPTTA